MPDSFPPDAEWPIDKMPAMPLSTGMRMVRVAFRELRYLHGKVNPSLLRQHVLAVRAAANKWEAEQSRLATEKANRFFTIAKGLAALGSAFGGGSIVTLLVEHLLLA